jgi:putative ABC transport system permease protein
MRLAWRELRRRPGRFTMATLTLAVLASLLLFLAGLLDGLYLGSTGAIRSQQADVFVYSDTSRQSFLRSRITPATRQTVAQTAGAAEVGGLGLALVGAGVPGSTELANAAVVGYELAPDGVPEPPAPGQAWADERLKADGVSVGDVLTVGAAGVPIEVIGFVRDTNYLLQGALWVDLATWRSVQNANRPDARVADDIVQVLVVRGDAGVSADELAARIDATTASLGSGSGATASLTKAEAEWSLPGTREQNATFNQILGVTFAVVVLIVALYFALLTLERIPLYGMLKAVGASTRQLFAGIVLQAVIVATAAFTLGAVVVGAGAAAAPPALPLTIEQSRVVSTYVVLVLCAVLGSLASLRRVVRIDPAQAIGGGS